MCYSDENEPFVPDEDFSHNFEDDPIDDGYNTPDDDNVFNDALDADVSDD